MPYPFHNTKLWRKWLKILLISIAGFVLLLTIGWFVLNHYLLSHKKQILENITTRISTNISGKLEIKDMEPALLNSFPSISVRLDSITLKDSLYEQHHIKTIALKHVFVEFNVISLFSKHPKIRKITLSDGSIHLFTLEDGYTNQYLFKGKQDGNSHKKPDIHLFRMENVTFVAQHKQRNKLFKIDCRDVNLKIKTKRGQMNIIANLNLFVWQLGFNLARGGYVKNKTVIGHIFLTFDRNKKTLTIKNQSLKIKEDPILVTGLFNFGHQPAYFDLDLKSPSIKLSEALSLLPQDISKKLQNIQIKKPINVNALIKGGFQYPDTPKVDIRVKIFKDDLNTPNSSFKNASALIHYSNHLHPGKGKGDDNSTIRISKMSCNWMDMPIRADSIIVENLKHPKLIARIKGRFPSSKLNKIIGRSFAITKGNVDFSIFYEGPIKKQDTLQRLLSGYILVKNTNLTYMPRSLHFSNCNAALIFDGNDLLIKSMTLSLANSTIQIKGIGKHFLNAYFSDPQKAVFDCSLNSPDLDLNAFLPLLSPRKQFGDTKHNKNLHNTNNLNKNLDDILDQSTMLLHLDVSKLRYNKFTAKNLRADLKLIDNDFIINAASLDHAGGRVTFNAKILQKPSFNKFGLKASLQKLNVNALFNAFNNFGQNTLKAENLKGQFSSKIDINGRLRENGKIVPHTLNGWAHFKLIDGELNNFSPFTSISKFAFKNRHLNQITFKTLKDSLIFKNGNILIQPMNIQSSAIFMEIQGIYSFGEGTDISMKIPLRNPSKDKKRIAHGLEPKRNKGIILYLRAKDGADGKVHIGWDPFHKGRPTDSLENE